MWQRIEIAGDFIYNIAVAPRVVLDTNVIIAGLQSVTGASRLLLTLLRSGDFEVCYSNALIYEYEEVLQRQRERIGIRPDQIELFLKFFVRIGRPQALHVRLRPQLRDPKDEHVLELAFNATCAYIVTFNLRDFTPVQNFGVQAIKPADFLDILGGRHE